MYDLLFQINLIKITIIPTQMSMTLTYRVFVLEMFLTILIESIILENCQTLKS